MPDVLSFHFRLTAFSYSVPELLTLRALLYIEWHTQIYVCTHIPGKDMTIVQKAYLFLIIVNLYQFP